MSTDTTGGNLLQMNQGNQTGDLTRRLPSFVLAWGAPIAILLALTFADLPIRQASLAVTACFMWMGVACAINAIRCRRRHCYFTSPVFLLGGVSAYLTGYNIIDIGQNGLTYVAWGTFLVAAIMYFPEGIWGKYIR